MKKSVRTITDYVINADTMVILPHFDKHGNLFSVVFEVDRRFYVNLKPWEIINNSCLFNGSSFQGRVEGAMHITKYNRMVPIMICNRQGIFFFPTQSAKSERCIWFAHDHIKSIIAADSESCEVLLNNRVRVPVMSTKAAFETKVNRTAQYRHLVNQQELVWQPHRFPLDLNDHQLVTLEQNGAYSFVKKDAEFLV